MPMAALEANFQRGKSTSTPQTPWLKFPPLRLWLIGNKTTESMGRKQIIRNRLLWVRAGLLRGWWCFLQFTCSGRHGRGLSSFSKQLRQSPRQPSPVLLPGEPPWTERPGGLQSTGSQRVWYDEASKHTWDKTQGQGLPSPLQNHSGSSSITQCPLHRPPPLDRPQHRMETRGWGVQEEPPLTTASPFQARPSPETPTGPVSEGHAHTLVCNNNDNLFS